MICDRINYMLITLRVKNMKQGKIEGKIKKNEKKKKKMKKGYYKHSKNKKINEEMIQSESYKTKKNNNK